MRRLYLSVLVLVGLCTMVAFSQERKGDVSDGTLIGGHLRYDSPVNEHWQRAVNVNSDDQAAYARHDHEGAIAIQVLPADAEMTPDMGSAIVRSLRDTHKKAGQKLLFGPKIEPDKRFALKVHEKYQVGDKTSDELHIYRNVGPRVVMLTVNSWSSDEGQTKEIHQTGEDALVSAKWSAKVKK